MATLPLHLESLDDPDPWPVEQKLFAILNEYLQPSSTTTPAVAAQGIDALTPMKRPDTGGREQKESPESFLWEIWDDFIVIAKQIPHDHPSQDRLVEVVKALGELPPTTVEIWTCDIRVWTDLPLLGPAMREAWISPTYDNSNPEPQAAVEWINQNSFAARLLNLDAVSWTSFPLWNLRSALEEESTSGKLACDVPVAAEWIKHSGGVLFEEIEETGEDVEEDGATAAGDLYKGKGVLSRHRWAFWRERFGDVGESERVGGDVQTVAQEAKRRMEAIERRM